MNTTSLWVGVEKCLHLYKYHKMSTSLGQNTQKIFIKNVGHKNQPGHRQYLLTNHLPQVNYPMVDQGRRYGMANYIHHKVKSCQNSFFLHKHDTHILCIFDVDCHYSWNNQVPFQFCLKVSEIFFVQP